MENLSTKGWTPNGGFRVILLICICIPTITLQKWNNDSVNHCCFNIANGFPTKRTMQPTITNCMRSLSDVTIGWLVFCNRIKYPAINSHTKPMVISHLCLLSPIYSHKVTHLPKCNVCCTFVLLQPMVNCLYSLKQCVAMETNTLFIYQSLFYSSQ